jgi:hypothetical protein
LPLEEPQQHVLGLLRATSAHLRNADASAPRNVLGKVLQVGAPTDEHRCLAAELHLPIDETDACAKPKQHLLRERSASMMEDLGQRVRHTVTAVKSGTVGKRLKFDGGLR